MAPVRKIGATTKTITGATGAQLGGGFTYLGFPKGSVDPSAEEIREVSILYKNTNATTVRIVHYDSAGTVKNDVTTASVTPGAAFASSDGTLSTNTVNAGANFPWTLAAGDSIAVTVVTGTSQVVSVTFTIAQKGV